MKKLFLLLPALIIISGFYFIYWAQPGNWDTVLSDPAIDVYDIYFLSNAQYGWAVGYNYASGNINSLVYKTINGGLEWVKQRFADSSYVELKGIFFINDSTGWMIGNLGKYIIQRTAAGSG